MPLPQPQPGLVIHYDYLWRDEAQAGRIEGRKSRPCVIVVAVHRDTDAIDVVVAPITHRPPTPPSAGIEIPPKVNGHLGLDDATSWIITTDLNVFRWPGMDLRPIPGGTSDRFTYGFVPPRLFERLRQAIMAHANSNRPTRRES